MSDAGDLALLAQVAQFTEFFAPSLRARDGIERGRGNVKGTASKSDGTAPGNPSALLGDLDPACCEALIAREDLDDAELRQTAQSTFPHRQYKQLAALREQRSVGALPPDEQIALNALVEQADLLTLRKAYAAVLLIWRGHSLPSLGESIPPVA